MPTTYLEAIREGLREEMARDPSVFLIGEDIGAYGGAFKVTAGFLEEFGERRVVDTPISESAIVGAAIGASLMGLRPVAEIQFSDFITCGYDQIVNFAAKCRYRWGAGVPIVIRAPSGNRDRKMGNEAFRGTLLGSRPVWGHRAHTRDRLNTSRPR